MSHRQRMNFLMKQKDRHKGGQGLTQRERLIVRRLLFVSQNSLHKSKRLPLPVSSAVTESPAPESLNLPLKRTHPAHFSPGRYVPADRAPRGNPGQGLARRIRADLHCVCVRNDDWNLTHRGGKGAFEELSVVSSGRRWYRESLIQHRTGAGHIGTQIYCGCWSSGCLPWRKGAPPRKYAGKYGSFLCAPTCHPHPLHASLSVAGRSSGFGF